MEGYEVSWDKTEANLAIGGLNVSLAYKVIEYTVAFTHPRTGAIVAAPIIYTVENMSEVEFPEVPAECLMEGYEVSWDKTEADLAIGGLNVSLAYKAIEYTATVVVNGEETTVSYTVENAAEKKAEIEAMKPANTAEYSYAWAEELPESLPLENGKVYTVNKTPIEYTVTFVDENGETVGTATYTVENKEITEPDVPTKEGYKGTWKEYTLTTGDVTVEADYVAYTYTITYDANGGSVEIEPQEVTYGEEYTLATATPSKIYQEFLGWVDEDGNDVVSGEAWAIPSDVTLTAKYSNVITFDSMTEVPSYLQNGGRASLSIVEGNGGKVLQATSENNDQGNVRIMMTLADMADFFEDENVQYLAFDLKLPEGATTPVSSIMYHNLDQSNYTAYESGQFDAPPTDAPKSYYLPRSVYEAWVANGKTEGRFLNVQAGITQGASYWIDNIRPVTAEEYMQDFYSFEHGGVRTNNVGQPLLYLNSDMSGWQLGISNVNETTAKFTNEIVSDGNRALQFTKYSGESAILMCHFADPLMEVAMREAGYVAFDLYVPEGSDAKIKKNGQEWYGVLKQGWNTIYEQVDATNNEIIRFTDTTASTYVIDNFRLLTETEYNAAKFGFETGGVIRHNNSSDDTTNGGYAYYYAGWDKANNKASIQVNEGSGANDVATLSNVRFATECVHGGDYSLAFDKKSGYLSLHMSSESTMYAALKNGFTFWIYSTVEMNGESEIQFINGLNNKLNGGNGVIIPANTWTQVTVSAEDIHATGRFLIMQGATEGTIYLDDFQPLPASDAE